MAKPSDWHRVETFVGSDDKASIGKTSGSVNRTMVVEISPPYYSGPHQTLMNDRDDQNVAVRNSNDELCNNSSTRIDPRSLSFEWCTTSSTIHGDADVAARATTDDDGLLGGADSQSQYSKKSLALSEVDSQMVLSLALLSEVDSQTMTSSFRSRKSLALSEIDSTTNFECNTMDGTLSTNSGSEIEERQHHLSPHPIIPKVVTTSPSSQKHQLAVVGHLQDVIDAEKSRPLLHSQPCVNVTPQVQITDAGNQEKGVQDRRPSSRPTTLRPPWVYNLVEDQNTKSSTASSEQQDPTPRTANLANNSLNNSNPCHSLALHHSVPDDYMIHHEPTLDHHIALGEIPTTTTSAARSRFPFTAEEENSPSAKVISPEVEHHRLSNVKGQTESETTADALFWKQRWLEAEQHAKTLSQRVAQEEELSKRLQSQLKEQTREKEALETQHDSSKEQQNREASQKVNQLLLRITQLESKLNSEKSDKEDLKDKVNELNGTRKELSPVCTPRPEHKDSTTEGQLQTLRSEHDAKLESKVKAQASHLAESKQQAMREVLDKAREDMNKIERRHKEELRQLESTINANMKEKLEAEKVIRELNSRLQVAESTSQTQKQELEEARQRLESCFSQSKMQVDASAKVESEKRTLEEEKRSLDKEVTELRLSLQSISKAKKASEVDYESQIVDLKRQSDLLASEADILRLDKANKEKHISDLEAKVAALSTVNTRLSSTTNEADLSAKKEKIQVLVSSNAALLAKLNSVESELSQKQSTIERLEIRFLESEASCKTMKESYERALRRNEEIESGAIKTKRVVSKLWKERGKLLRINKLLCEALSKQLATSRELEEDVRSVEARVIELLSVNKKLSNQNQTLMALNRGLSIMENYSGKIPSNIREIGHPQQGDVDSKVDTDDHSNIELEDAAEIDFKNLVRVYQKEVVLELHYHDNERNENCCNVHAKYTGELMNDLPHGPGTLRFLNGDLYLGEFKEGEMHGVGAFNHVGSDQGKNQTFTGIFDRNEYCGNSKLEKHHAINRVRVSRAKCTEASSLN